MPTPHHRPPWRPDRGLTVAELMIVVAIIAVLAGVAVWSMTPNISKSQIADFAEDIQTAFKEARSRACGTGNRYAVKLTDATVQWCEDDCPPNQPAGKEIGPVKRARGNVKALSYAKAADIGITALPPRTALGTITVYFFGDCTLDSDRATAEQEGFTVYLQHQDRTNLQYRVAVLPLSGDIRKYDQW